MFKKWAQFDWHFIHKRYRTPFYTYLLWDGSSRHYDQSVTFRYECPNFIYLDTHIAIAEPDWQRLRKRLSLQLKAQPLWLKRQLFRAGRSDRNVVRFAQKSALLDYSTVSREQLIDLWEEYLRLTNIFTVPILLPLFIESDMEQRLKQLIDAQWGKNKTEEIFQVLTTPLQQGAAQDEHLSLLRLAIKQHRGQNIERGIARHLYNFSWTKNNSFDGRFSTAGDVKKSLLALKSTAAEQYRTYQAKIKRSRQLFTRYYRILAKDRQAKNLIDTLQESIFYRSWRTERYYRTAYFLQPLFRHTAQVLGISESDLFFLMPPEIIECLRKRRLAPKKPIAERKTGYLLYSDGKGSYCYSGPQLRQAKKEFRLQQTGSQQELSGQTAFPGQVSGLTTVISSKRELGKIKANTILVTPSTTVDYTPYLKKVKAIITEEGGVLSHASVISRELHIPCVIGVRQVTTILRTGDRITVDATHGVIRKLSV